MNTFRLVYFFLFASYATVVPYFQILLARLGYSPARIGLLLGAFELFGFAGPFVLGSVVDRTGRFRRTIAVGILLAFAGLLPLLARPDFVVAILLAGLFGFGFKSNVPLVDALASHLLEDPDRDYGVVRMWGSLAFAVVVIVITRTGVMNIESAPSMAANFAVSLLIFFVAVQVLPSSVRGSGVPDDGDAQEPISPWLYVTVAIVFVVNFGFAAYTSFFSLYLVTELGLKDVSVMWAIGAFAEIPVILYSGNLLRRFGAPAMIAAAAVSMIVRLLAYAATASPVVVALMQPLHAVSFGVMHTASISLVRTFTPTRRRALGQAIYNGVGMGLSLLLGAALGGIIAERWGYRATYAWAAIPVAAGLVMVLALYRPLRNKSRRAVL